MREKYKGKAWQNWVVGSGTQGSNNFTPTYILFIYYFAKQFSLKMYTHRGKVIFKILFYNKAATYQLTKPQRAQLAPLLMSLWSWGNHLAPFASISACMSGLFQIILVFASWSKCIISSISCYDTCLCSTQDDCVPVLCCHCNANNKNNKSY